MSRRSKNIAVRFVALALSFCTALGGCGGSKVLKEPVALELKNPLGFAANEDMSATLDWVVVKDGPGTWARNAWWDEYRLQVKNRSDKPVSIVQIQVIDSLDKVSSPVANRKLLVDLSKATENRYEDYDLLVRPGVNSENMMVVGAAGTLVVTTTVAGVAAASAVGASASSVAPAIVSMAYAAPLFIVGGIVHVSNNSAVDEEIVRRHTKIPIDIRPGEVRDVSAFFPVTPSPQSVQIIYETEEGTDLLAIDTGASLHGLHIADMKSPVVSR